MDDDDGMVLGGTVFTEGGHYSLVNCVLGGTVFTEGGNYSLVNCVLGG